MEVAEFAVDWSPVIATGGTYLTMAVGAVLAYSRVKKMVPKIPGLTSGATREEKLAKKVNSAVGETAKLLSAKIMFDLHDTMMKSSVLGVAAAQTRLKDRTILKEEKKELLEKLRVSSLAWLVVVPYLRALITTTVSIRMAAILIAQDEHDEEKRKQDAEDKKKAAKASPSAQGGGGLASGLLQGSIEKMLQEMMSMNTVFTDPNATLGLEVFTARFLGALADLLESTLLPIAVSSVLLHLPVKGHSTSERPINFGIMSTVVYTDFEAALQTARSNFERTLPTSISVLGAELQCCGATWTSEDSQKLGLEDRLLSASGGGMRVGGASGGIDPLMAMLGGGGGGMGSADPFLLTSNNNTTGPDPEKLLDEFRRYMEDIDALGQEVIAGGGDSFQNLVLSHADLEVVDIWQRVGLAHSPAVAPTFISSGGQNVMSLFQGTKMYNYTSNSANMLQMSTALLGFVKNRHNPPLAASSSGVVELVDDDGGSNNDKQMLASRAEEYYGVPALTKTFCEALVVSSCAHN